MSKILTQYGWRSLSEATDHNAGFAMQIRGLSGSEARRHIREHEGIAKHLKNAISQARKNGYHGVANELQKQHDEITSRINDLKSKA